MISSEDFWNKKAAKYAKSPIKNEQAYEETLAHTRRFLTAGDHVLEFGCGTGTTALKLASSVARITASDISENMIEIGRKKAADQSIENVDFIAATTDDQRFDEKHYDAVLAFNFLHLVEDLDTALMRINQIVKPGGFFVSKTVCLKGHMPIMRNLIPLMQLIGMAPYVKTMSAADLEGIIENAGFDIVETGDYPAKSPSHFVVARKR